MSLFWLIISVALGIALTVLARSRKPARQLPPSRDAHNNGCTGDDRVPVTISYDGGQVQVAELCLGCSAQITSLSWLNPLWHLWNDPRSRVVSVSRPQDLEKARVRWAAELPVFDARFVVPSWERQPDGQLCRCDSIPSRHWHGWAPAHDPEQN